MADRPVCKTCSVARLGVLRRLPCMVFRIIYGRVAKEFQKPFGIFFRCCCRQFLIRTFAVRCTTTTISSLVIRWKGVVRPVFYLLNNSNFSPDGVVLSGGIVSSLPPDRPPPSFLHSLVHWASLPLQAHCRCRWQHIFAAVFPLLQREKNANTGVIGGQVGNTRTYRQHYIIMYSHFILSYFHSIREEKNSISLLDLKFQRQRNMYMHAKLRSHLCTV